MIQLTYIDAIAWGVILMFCGGYFGMLFTQRTQVNPISDAFDVLNKLMLKHIEGDMKLIKELQGIYNQMTDQPIKSPIQLN